MRGAKAHVGDPVNEALDRLVRHVRPVSVFLYGSKARGDDTAQSDYELGVVMERDRAMRRRDLAALLALEGLRGYPYVYEDLVRGEIKTPFQKAVFLRELASTAQTLYGECIVESLDPPPLQVLDAIMDMRLQVGRALAALVEVRNGDLGSASENLYKSCLLGSRLLIIESTGKFPVTNFEILDAAESLAPSEYKHLLELVSMLREGHAVASLNDCYDNIAWLTDYIEPRLLDALSNPEQNVLLQ